MATATSTVSGLISGLDTNTIISQLMALERQPLLKLQEQQNTANQQKSAFTTINTSLLALKTSMDTLASADSWAIKTATVSDPDVLSATATSETAAGTYSFRVRQLAQAGQLASAGYADADTTPVNPAGGSFDITVGARTETITLGATDTLADVAAAINAEDMGVSAVVVNTGQGGTPYRLVLTSEATGAANAAVISGDTAGLWPRWLDSNGYATADSTPVGGGEFDITANGNTAHVVIAAGDSLQIAASKINAANPDVLAEVVGSADGTYKLSITSAYSDLAVTDNMSGLWSAAAPAVVSGTVLSEAQNALLEFGTGTPMEVESATNSVTGLAPGLTVNLKTVSASQVTVTIASDTEGLLEYAQDFVAKYNDVIGKLKTYDSYDVDNNKASILFANNTLRQLEMDLGNVISTVVAGQPAETDNLTMVGFTLGTDGKLSLDENVFSAALDAHPEDVASLFSGVIERTLASQGGSIGGPAAGSGSLANLIDGSPSGVGFTSANTIAGDGGTHTFRIDFSSASLITQLSLTTMAGNGIRDFTLDLLTATGWQTVSTTTGFTGTDFAYVLSDPISATAMRLNVTAANGDDYTRLQEIGATEESGAAHQISNLLSFVTDGIDGTIAGEKSSLDTKISSLQETIDDLEARLEAKEERLKREFAAMESALAQMQTQSSYLSKLSSSKE